MHSIEYIIIILMTFASSSTVFELIISNWVPHPIQVSFPDIRKVTPVD
ncbi:MAG: Flp pilus assembly protein protease CpaA [Bacillariaceae sp.]|jgi:hypothetical protein